LQNRLSVKTLLSLMVALGSFTAVGETSEVGRPAGTVESTATADRPARESHRFGILVDAGVPDGVALSVGFRPLRWVRLEVGVLENSISPGLRGGLTLIPLNYWITPTLTVEAGHYFSGNANRLVQRLSHNESAFIQPLLQDFNYEFGNAHLGLELGSSRFAFYLHGGLSYVTSTVRNVQLAFQQSSSDVSVKDAKDVKVTYRGPSAKLGFVVYFL
jgi:hypothetical protein